MSVSSYNMFKVRILTIVAVVLMMLIFISCDQDLVYEKSVRIPGSEWSRYHIPVFEVDITDTLNLHNLLINIRNTGEYPRSNLFLFISATSPVGAFVRDTLELILAEPSGKWKGRGFGSVWQNRFIYRQNVRFPDKGKYKFEFEQAMRIDELPGVLDVGLRVEKLQR